MKKMTQPVITTNNIISRDEGNASANCIVSILDDEGYPFAYARFPRAQHKNGIFVPVMYTQVENLTEQQYRTLSLATSIVCPNGLTNIENVIREYGPVENIEVIENTYVNPDLAVTNLMWNQKTESFEVICSACGCDVGIIVGKGDSLSGYVLRTLDQIDHEMWREASRLGGPLGGNTRLCNPCRARFELVIG